MDFEQNNNQAEPTQDNAIIEPASKPAKTGAGWRIFLGIILALSILVNILLVFMLIAVIAVFAAGPGDKLAEELIQSPLRTP